MKCEVVKGFEIHNPNHNGVIVAQKQGGQQKIELYLDGSIKSNYAIANDGVCRKVLEKMFWLQDVYNCPSNWNEIKIDGRVVFELFMGGPKKEYSIPYLKTDKETYRLKRIDTSVFWFGPWENSLLEGRKIEVNGKFFLQDIIVESWKEVVIDEGKGY